MLISEILEQHKKESLDFNLNFLINREDKEDLDKLAKKGSISTSKIIRTLIKRFIQENREDLDDSE